MNDAERETKISAAADKDVAELLAQYGQPTGETLRLVLKLAWCAGRLDGLAAVKP